MIRRLALICLTASSLGLAQGTTKGFGFLELPYAARNASLGDALVADPTHTLSSILNPALLSVAASPSVYLSRQQWIEDLRSNFLFVGIPFSVFNAGISLSTTTIPGIEVRDIPGPPLGTFSAHSATLAALASFNVDPDLSLGFSIKHLYEKLYVDEATAVLFDLGAMVRTPFAGFTAGVSVRNFGVADKMRERTSRVPTEIRYGLAYETQVDQYKVLGAIGILTGSSTGFHAGIELGYARTAMVRLGYQSSFDSRAFSAGIGLEYNILLIDYSYIPFARGFADGHLVTIGVQIQE